MKTVSHDGVNGEGSVTEIMSESMVDGVSESVVDGVSSVVGAIAMSKVVVWDGHVMVWLSVETVLNEVFLVGSESPESVLLLSLALAFDGFVGVGLVVLNLGTESGLIVVRGQLVVSLWLVKVLLIMMDWAVFWGVWVVMVCTDVMSFSVSVMVWGDGVMSPAVSVTVVWRIPSVSESMDLIFLAVFFSNND